MILQSQTAITKVIEMAEDNDISHNKELIDTAIEQTTNPHPWYIQSALGISAWIAGLIFAEYVRRSLHLPQTYIGLLIGMALYAIGIIIFRLKPRSITSRQFGLAVSLAGMIISTSFVFELTKLPWSAGLLMITFESLVFWLHADPVRRYIAITNGLPALMFILASMKSALAYQLVVPLGLYAVYFLWNRQSWQFSVSPKILKPLKYGLPVALFVIVQGLVSNQISTPVKTWDITNSLTVIILAKICYNELRRLNLLQPINILGLIVLVSSLAIITVDSPGILVSITVTMIGFQNANKLLRMQINF